MSLGPFLIAGPPRSGTSMTAGLLAAHGVHVGHFKGPHADNPKGGYENAVAKAVMKCELARSGYDLNPIRIEPTTMLPCPTFGEEIDAALPGSPWLVKEFRILMTWPLWAEHFPEATYIFTRRPIDDVVASMKAHRVISKRGPDAALRRWVEWSYERQDEIAAAHPHIYVDVDRLWDRDLGTALGMIESLGLTFDEAATLAWIDPSLHHHGERA